jgi:hypothetical protein
MPRRFTTVRPVRSRRISPTPRYALRLSQSGCRGSVATIEMASRWRDTHPFGPVITIPGPATLTCHCSPAGIMTTRDPSGSFTATSPPPPTDAEPVPLVRPIRTSTSSEVGEGAPVGLAGTEADVQPASPPVTSSAAARGQRAGRLAPVIPKLQLDPEILTLEK